MDLRKLKLPSKKTFVAISALAVFGLANANPFIYTVVKVLDGDTIVVQKAGHEQTIRLVGVDTPEVESQYRQEACYGKEASQETKRLLPAGKTVMLLPDPYAGNKDKYGRLLRYVFTDGKMINAYLVDRGLAFNYIYSKTASGAYFHSLERSARQKRVGLWSEKCNYFFETKE